MAELGRLSITIERSAKDGLHTWADHYIIKVIDPGTKEQLSIEGEGELVITTLTREAVPLIRYRAGDIVKLLPSECSCRLKNQKSIRGLKAG